MLDFLGVGGGLLFGPCEAVSIGDDGLELWL